MSKTFAEAVFDFDGACNDFAATLDPGAPLEDVIAEFDRRLDRYGGLGAYGRKDQISNRYLSDEISQLRGPATMTPTIFLAVAAFTLHMLMARLVATQRTQIALLRAFGYTTGELVRHYLKLALGIGVLGAAAGAGLGIWFGRKVAEIYGEFYSFPMLAFSVDPVAVDTSVTFRSGPNKGSDNLGGVYANHKVQVIARNVTATWFYIIAPDTPDGCAWVLAAAFTFQGDLTRLPIAYFPKDSKIPTLLPPLIYTVPGGTPLPLNSPAPGAVTAQIVQLAKVRVGPGVGYMEMGLLDVGSVVVLTGRIRGNAWLQIEYPSGWTGAVGYRRS